MFHMESSAVPSFARPDATARITRGVVRFCLDQGWAPLTEFRLASGRRVDVACLDKKGVLIFVEVKSCRADFDADNKWTDYLGYCDRFYFAVDGEFPCELIADSAGLMLADGFGAAIVRDGETPPLPAARRKAVTLRFARQSAGRLVGDVV